MRIGVDIDGVLNNLEQFQIEYGSKYCIDYDLEFHLKADEYDTIDMFGWKEEDEHNFWKSNIEYYASSYPARKLASEILHKLKEEGNEIIIITFRHFTDQDNEMGDWMRNLVKEWLSKFKIPYDKIIFCKGSKVPYCLEEKIDVMIDDWIDNISEIAKHMPVIIYDAKYNQNSIYKNTYRCYSWPDIYKQIHELKE